MHPNLKRRLAVGAAVLAAVAFAGGAYAATQVPALSARQAFVNDVAKRLGVSPQKLDSAVHSALIDRINAAVAAGRLTKAQAGRLEQRLAHHRRGPLMFLRFGLRHRRAAWAMP